MSQFTKKILHGTGLGLRSCHFDYVLKHRPDVPWFEALTDNYFHDAVHCHYLTAIREHYPITLHGVGMSLGSTDPLNIDYLAKVKRLADKIGPVLISDHLSWSSIKHRYLPDLLPLPFTEETITHVSERILQVQDFLGVPLMIENASAYLHYKQSDMPEWEFIKAITKKTGCYVLLDVNNLYVTATNLGFDPDLYLQHIDKAPIKQLHLAGYSDENTYLFDMHNQPIHDPVWALYRKALQQLGSLPTLIERDENIPDFETLQTEAKKADVMMKTIEAMHADVA